MGKIDAKSKAFFSNSRNFADLINGAVFNGRPVVNPKDLEEMNVERIHEQENVVTSVDISKRWTINGVHLGIIPIESQAYIDYGMIIRNMVNESLGYRQQVKDIISYHQNEKDIEKDISDDNEFLSGITRSDMLTPIITVVVYLGAKKWDAPRQLYDMLDIEEGLKSYVYNYSLNLVDYHDYEDFDSFKGEVKKLFTILSNRKDKKRIIDFFKTNRYMNKVTAGLIGSIINLNVSKFRRVTLKGEVMDTFEAIEEYYQDGVLEGEEKGLEALVRTIKDILPDFENVYSAVITNEVYKDVTKEQVRKYYTSPS